MLGQEKITIPTDIVEMGRCNCDFIYNDWSFADDFLDVLKYIINVLVLMHPVILAFLLDYHMTGK